MLPTEPTRRTGEKFRGVGGIALVSPGGTPSLTLPRPSAWITNLVVDCLRAKLRACTHVELYVVVIAVAADEARAVTRDPIRVGAGWNTSLGACIAKIGIPAVCDTPAVLLGIARLQRSAVAEGFAG